MIGKRKIFWFCAFCSLYFTISISAQSPSPDSFVRRNGKVLIDSTGKEVKLRGVDLGGWLLWEEWIWGEGFKSQTTILERLSSIIGSENAYKFQDSVYRNYVTEADIKEIASCGFNLVRVPFNCRIFDFADNVFSYKGIGWGIFDSLIAWCHKYHVYVIPEMHAAPGGQTIWWPSDPSPKISERLWYSALRQQQTLDLWQAIAKRYAGNKTVAGYDLLGEPSAKTNSQLVDFYKRIINAIRKEDKVHLMVVEGGNFANRFGFFTGLLDSNMVFSFHQYTWFGENPEKAVAVYKDLSERFNVPLWCGEFGENRYEIVRNTVAIYERPENHIAGWAYWTWKKVPNYFNDLCGVIKTEGWDALVKWIHHPATRKKPSTEQATKAISEFLKNIKFQNNIMDPTMMGILKPH
ncbi:MAG TPA: cellulase family glycosylhydrolase [Bacteroidia bacterium]|jgi:endoglucanase|nr:cellulase family glycosylhydrolase [Bacteroidia bacterium]